MQTLPRGTVGTAAVLSQLAVPRAPGFGLGRGEGAGSRENVPLCPALPNLFFSPFVAYQATQQYSFGTGGPALYQPQQPLSAPASAPYPNPATNTTPPYLPSAPAHPAPTPLYPGQPQPSPTGPNPASSFPLPPSGASFQHGRPGLPATSVAYALPTGPTGTLPAASDLPASQRTGLRLDGGQAGRGRVYEFGNSPTRVHVAS